MRPGLPLVVLAALSLALALAGLWLPAAAAAVPWLLGGAGVLAAADLGLLALQPLPQVTRRLPAQARRGQTFTVSLDLSLPRPSRLRLEVFDSAPPELRTPAFPLVTTPHSQQLDWPAAALLPGRLSLGPVWLTLFSPLRLWSRTVRRGQSAHLKVYPPLPVSGRKFLGLTGRPEAGAPRLVRRRGQGTEFHQLREYRTGDSPRQVDWRATSRLRRLIVREHQEEQNQDVVFVLDTGYRMHARDGGVSHLQRAIEALLATAAAALRQGDAVGLCLFGAVRHYQPPKKGQAALRQLAGRLYDLKSQPVASSPAEALETTLRRLKKRSLVILLSNLREEDSEGLGPHLPLLRRRHLLLTVWLRETVLAELAADPGPTGQAARTALSDRERLQALLKAQGVLALDTDPARLDQALVTAWWTLKRQGKL